MFGKIAPYSTVMKVTMNFYWNNLIFLVKTKAKWLACRKKKKLLLLKPMGMLSSILFLLKLPYETGRKRNQEPYNQEHFMHSYERNHIPWVPSQQDDHQHASLWNGVTSFLEDTSTYMKNSIIKLVDVNTQICKYHTESQLQPARSFIQVP